MLPGETILTGASKTCETCGDDPPFEVMASAAGWYIGTRCVCGPYSRESRYWDRESEANLALVLWGEGYYVGARGVL